MTLRRKRRNHGTDNPAPIRLRQQRSTVQAERDDDHTITDDDLENWWDYSDEV